MQVLDCSNIEDYLAVIASDKDQKKITESCLLVTISRFFRDRQLWECMAETILPELVRSFPDRIRVWSVGCACGEEAFSLSILWHRLTTQATIDTKMDILATDVNRCVLKKPKKAGTGKAALKKLMHQSWKLISRKSRAAISMNFVPGRSSWSDGRPMICSSPCLKAPFKLYCCATTFWPTTMEKILTKRFDWFWITLFQAVILWQDPTKNYRQYLSIHLNETSTVPLYISILLKKGCYFHLRTNFSMILSKTKILLRINPGECKNNWLLGFYLIAKIMILPRYFGHTS